MAKWLEGTEQLVENIRSRAKRAKGSDVIVGYEQPYAVFVHENLEAHHPVGQAKYLEQPMRQHRRELLRYISVELRKGRLLQDVLFEAGNILLDASLPLVPVDTGALKSSGFVEVDTSKAPR